MRDIKYRALYAATNKWVYGYYVVLDSGYELVECIWELGAKRATPIDRSTLGQFTGLTDKNGKEIYEGDILGRYGYVVSFVDGADSAALGMPMGWYEQRDDFESYRQLEVGDIKEVIGNIHQHRYLLKEKN